MLVKFNTRPLWLLCSILILSVINVSAQKLSQFEKAGMCDLLIDKAGTYHAVFQESPDYGKPVFIYYCVSTNKGASWSKPVTISNDNTGNGAGFPRILQDGRGVIYAFWKRYGNTASQYPVKEVILDGRGGYEMGTVFYKVLNGGTWSEQVQLNEDQTSQVSWFATVNPQGNINVFWTQLSFESIKTKQNYWWYCDLMRVVTLNGTSKSAITNLSTPAVPAYAGGAPATKEGGNNLDGYVDRNNSIHFIYEDDPDNAQQVKYFDGKTERIIYSYPKYHTQNTFNNPARLFVDEQGIDHIIFKPDASTLESEQIWDINLATNKTNVIVSIQKTGVKITGFQASQGPGGSMSVVIEARGTSDNIEAFGCFYQNGNWRNVGLTNNASKEKFFSKEFTGLGGYRTVISTLTRYNSQFGSVAYDAAGKKAMLLTIAAYWTTGGYSTSSPSVVFIPIDK